MAKAMVAANWKMNGSFELLQAFAKETWQTAQAEVVFGLPSIFLHAAQKLGLENLAGEDVSAHESGAFTGETSAQMLKSTGCKYCIIGHSERRLYHHEKEALLLEKWQQLKKVGIKPIYCVGETEAEFSAGKTEEVLTRQLMPMLEAELVDAQTVLAYEPVWAIGTGKTATPEYAQKIHRIIREKMLNKYVNIPTQMRILYGGSVQAANAKLLISEPDIDGFLVGGASLKVDAFKKIIEAIE